MIDVIWSDHAKNEILDIRNYWIKRNKSKAYSNKILFHTEIAINLIRKIQKLECHPIVLKYECD